MKDIFKGTVSVLLAALIILGAWVGVRAWEVHHQTDLLSAIINCPPSAILSNEEGIDALGRASVTVRGSVDYEYVVVRIVLHFDTYNVNGNHSKIKWVDIGVENLYASIKQEVSYQLTLEELQHLEKVDCTIVRYKLR